MDQKEKMKNDFLEDLDGYYMQLVYLKDLCKVSDHVYLSEKELQCAPNFTLITESALVDAAILILMRLYDSSEKAMTIQNLINKAKKNIHLFSSQDDTLTKLNEFETELNQDENILDTIKTLTKIRDSIHVHNDKKYFGKKMSNNEFSFSMSDARFLILFAAKVLDYLSSKLSYETQRKTKYNKDLINLIKETNQENIDTN